MQNNVTRVDVHIFKLCFALLKYRVKIIIIIARLPKSKVLMLSNNFDTSINVYFSRIIMKTVMLTRLNRRLEFISLESLFSSQCLR